MKKTSRETRKIEGIISVSDKADFSGLRLFAGKPYTPVPSIPDQIYERLDGWISTQPASTSLPPERILAKMMQVNRLTLRKALLRFVSDGLLLRGPRGSVTNSLLARRRKGNPANTEMPHPELHPLQTGTMPLSFPAKPLTIAVYETFPGHVRFWRRAEEEYNRRPGARKMELIWVPNSVSDKQSYADFIREKKVSMALAGVDIIPWLERNKLLSTFPSWIMKMLRSPDYLVSELVEYYNPFKSHAVPLHYSSPCIAWNRDLAQDPPSPEALCAQTLVDWWREIAGAVPSSVEIFDSPYAMVGPHGIPAGPLEGDVFRKTFRPIFETARSLSPCSGRIGMDRSYFTNDMTKFRAGKVACCAAHGFFLLNEYSKASFPMGIGFLRPGKGSCHPCTTTMICMTGNPSEAEACADAAEFMLSCKIQSILVDELVNMPVRSECAGDLASRIGLGDDAVKNWSRNARFLDKDQIVSDLFLFWRMPFLADAVLRGRRIDAGLFEEAMREYRAIREENLVSGK